MKNMNNGEETKRNFTFIREGGRMNTGCFKCDKAQWDADGCTCEITGLLVGNAKKGCEYRKDTELKACPFCGSDKVCAECKGCWYYYMNSDTENVCSGDSMPCFEFEPLPWTRRAENDDR